MLLAAPESLVVSGAVYRATAFVWRNFQPTVGGTPDMRLSVGVRLVATPGDTLIERPKYAWVIHDGQNWGAELGVQEYSAYWGYVAAAAYGGPEWPLEDSVRTIIGVPDSTGFIRLLRCRPDGVVTKIQ